MNTFECEALALITPEDRKGGLTEVPPRGLREFDVFYQGDSPPPTLRLVEGASSPRGQELRVRLETSLVVRFAHEIPQEELEDAVIEAVADAIPQACAVNLDTCREAQVLFDLEPEEISIEEAA